MKLRNNKTGKIIELNNIDTEEGPITSLAELNAEWEDYEEPEYWFITGDGFIYQRNKKTYPEEEKARKELGNYFETKEEAEKALEKLKAWKRLRDNGLRFSHYEIDPKRKIAIVEVRAKRGPVLFDQAAQFVEDLDLIFGGDHNRE